MRGSEINRPSDAHSDHTDDRAQLRMRRLRIFGNQAGTSRSSGSGETSSSRNAHRPEPPELREVDAMSIPSSEASSSRRAHRPEPPELREVDAISISSSEDSSPRHARRPEFPEFREVITISSGEDSPPHSVHESWSPERGESSMMGQLLGRMRRAMEWEKKTREEEQQKLQQELNHVQEQLRKAKQKRHQARGQLREAQQEHARTQEQLAKTQQDLNRTRQQLTKALHERDQALRGRRILVQEQLRQMRIQEEQTRDRCYETVMDAPGQLDRQYERGQSSTEELRVNDALPTTLEGMEEQLERERRIQQESRGREQQIREHVRRPLRERGEDLPINERLSEFLRQKIGNIISDYCLEEELFPDQQDRKPLRERLRDLSLQTRTEFTSRGLQEHQIAGEFVYQLERQMREHNRQDWETTQVIEDIQELVNGENGNRRTSR